MDFQTIFGNYALVGNPPYSLKLCGVKDLKIKTYCYFMKLISITEELKSMLLFAGAGTAMGGVSSILGGAILALPVGFAALVGLKKGAEKMFNMDASAIMQSGVMPYLTFWYMVWVLAINA